MGAPSAMSSSVSAVAVIDRTQPFGNNGPRFPGLPLPAQPQAQGKKTAGLGKKLVSRYDRVRGVLESVRG